MIAKSVTDPADLAKLCEVHQLTYAATQPVTPVLWLDDDLSHVRRWQRASAA